MEPYQELSRSIAGKVALVTGAASGMGRATAHLFAAEGAHVAVSDINAEGCEAVVKEITDKGGDAVAYPLDMGDKDAIKATVDAIAERWGSFDILINNAGLVTGGDWASDDYEAAWDLALSVMLTGQMRAARAALPHMQKQNWGRIVNIASTEGLGATPGNSSYVAAKHGSIGLTRALAVDLGREGITTNCICPGPIRTGITDAIPDEHKEIFSKRRVPLRRYGIPEEVAHITLSLVLPAASFLNGVAIPVDGGLTIKNA